MSMPNKPCRREGCSITTEVCGEADELKTMCFYPDAEWEAVELDQVMECEACKMLSIHCGHLVDVRITQSKSKHLSFRLHGSYNRPINSDDLYMTIQAPNDPQCPYSLLLHHHGYLCEAFNRNRLTLDITIPANHRFNTLAINGRSIHSSIMLLASTRIRLNADDDISAKLSSPRIYAYAKTGICLSCLADKQSSLVDMACDNYIELTLDGYDSCEVVCSSGNLISQKYRLSLFPVTFKGKVISKTGEAMII